MTYNLFNIIQLILVILLLVFSRFSQAGRLSVLARTAHEIQISVAEWAKLFIRNNPSRSFQNNKAIMADAIVTTQNLSKALKNDRLSDVARITSISENEAYEFLWLYRGPDGVARAYLNIGPQGSHITNPVIERMFRSLGYDEIFVRDLMKIRTKIIIWLNQMLPAPGKTHLVLREGIVQANVFENLSQEQVHNLRLLIEQLRRVTEAYKDSEAAIRGYDKASMSFGF